MHHVLIKKEIWDQIQGNLLTQPWHVADPIIQMLKASPAQVIEVKQPEEAVATLPDNVISAPEARDHKTSDMYVETPVESGSGPS